MKYTMITLLLLSSALASVCWGQTTPTVTKGLTVKEQLATLSVQAAPLSDKRKELQDAVKALNQTDKDIKSGLETIEKYANKYKNDKAAYDLDLAGYSSAFDSLTTQLSAHNGNPCVEHDHDGSCAAYNGEADRLNARGDEIKQQQIQLDQRLDFLNTTRGQLKELSQILSDKTEKWTADVKKWNSDNDDNEAKITAIRNRWQELMSSMGSCLDKLPTNATDEDIHEACGAKWDGNKVTEKPQPFKNKGTGGITPNLN
ncbi:MAG TPA: hypothetical protein VKT33_01120 [Candidatus Angelobacter sp.]|nr:hypothetical protein [Candidatus Angelobacter sp.]